jgi:hypothetical protein
MVNFLRNLSYTKQGSSMILGPLVWGSLSMDMGELDESHEGTLN